MYTFIITQSVGHLKIKNTKKYYSQTDLQTKNHGSLIQNTHQPYTKKPSLYGDYPISPMMSKQNVYAPLLQNCLIPSSLNPNMEKIKNGMVLQPRETPA